MVSASTLYFDESVLIIIKSIGLYLHIPFCVKKCNYCDFYSVKCSNELMDEYVKHLEKNIHLWAMKLHDRTVDTIYFGGGTPSVLGTSRILRILEYIRSSFNLAEDCEISIEVNPNSTDELDFFSLKKGGINRVSMGLQSADDNELKLLGRMHTAADAENSINALHKSGIDNFSLDVMLGIPLQTYDSLGRTLDFCIDSGATHISTYMLKIEENTPFYHNKEQLVFADDDLQADLYEFTTKKLKSNGFRHYEISNFCRTHMISRHNMKYWMLDDYLGIGPSAHSMIDNKRFYYDRSFDEFYNNHIVFESEGGTPEEYLMLSLRTDYGFNYEKYKELFKTELPQCVIDEVRNLEKLGLINISDKGFALSEKGFLLSNSVIYRLLSKGI